MKDVYIKNPQMGDPTSVDPRLSEIGQNIEKLQLEAQKFEVSYVLWHREAVHNEENMQVLTGGEPPPATHIRMRRAAAGHMFTCYMS